MSINIAASEGNLPLVIQLHNRNERCTEDVMEYAVSNKHITILNWLFENREDIHTEDVMEYAVSNGHSQVVEWLFDNRTDTQCV